MPPLAEMQPFPPSFRTQDIQANGTTLHVRIGGHGPAVVLLHGYGETGDMWASMAAECRTTCIMRLQSSSWCTPSRRRNSEPARTSIGA
jgi:pimeloyl-ACP methyl ester carboxylesterase